MDANTSTAIRSRMRQLEIRTRRLVNDSLVGEYQSVFKGRGMNFDEVREYVEPLAKLASSKSMATAPSPG